MAGMQSMELQDLGWGPEQISILTESLPFAKALKQLALDYNPIGPRGAALLAKSLPQCQRLQEMHMIGVKLQDEGVEALCTALPQTTLALLDIKRNNITSRGAQVPGFSQDCDRSWLLSPVLWWHVEAIRNTQT